MHFTRNAGLNGLKSPAQRSGQFSELGSAQLNSFSWLLDGILHFDLDWIELNPNL